MAKHPVTPGYIFFYILFSPDTWRILAGIALAALLAPSLIATREMGPAGSWMVSIMVAGIGYGASAWPAKKFAGFLRQRILGGRR